MRRFAWTLLPLLLITSRPLLATTPTFTSLKDYCARLLAEVPNFKRARADLAAGIFPSGHNPVDPQATAALDDVDFRIALKDNVEQAQKRLNERVFDSKFYVETLHRDAETQALFIGTHPFLSATLALVLHEHASALAQLHKLAARRLNETKSDISPELLSELIAITRIFESLPVVDAAIDLTNTLLDNPRFNAHLREPERRLLTFSAQELRYAQLPDHLEDAAAFHAIERGFLAIAKLQNWGPELANAQALQVINRTLMLVPEGQVSLEHLEFLEEMRAHVPRQRHYVPSAEFAFGPQNEDFLTRHEIQIKVFDPALYLFWEFAASYPTNADAYVKH